MIKLHKNQSGVIHHLLIIGLAILVIVGAGFAGYRVWKNKGIDAHAENYKYQTILAADGVNQFMVYACTNINPVKVGGYQLFVKVTTTLPPEVKAYYISVWGSGFRKSLRPTYGVPKYYVNNKISKGISITFNSLSDSNIGSDFGTKKIKVENIASCN